jgi:hypothetical protein
VQIVVERDGRVVIVAQDKYMSGDIRVPQSSRCIRLQTKKHHKNKLQQTNCNQPKTLMTNELQQTNCNKQSETTNATAHKLPQNKTKTSDKKTTNNKKQVLMRQLLCLRLYCTLLRQGAMAGWANHSISKKNKQTISNSNRHRDDKQQTKPNNQTKSRETNSNNKARHEASKQAWQAYSDADKSLKLKALQNFEASM